MISWLKKLFYKPKRLELRLVPYYPDGDRLCREGWVIAKEEDHNRMIGFVFLERLETPNAIISRPATDYAIPHRLCPGRLD